MKHLLFSLLFLLPLASYAQTNCAEKVDRDHKIIRGVKISGDLIKPKLTGIDTFITEVKLSAPPVDLYSDERLKPQMPPKK